MHYVTCSRKDTKDYLTSAPSVVAVVAVVVAVESVEEIVAAEF